MKLAIKLVYLLFFLILTLLTISGSKLKVLAQVPNPKIPCEGEESPEFNSLRPYQASPCGDSSKTYFCGNNIIIKEEVQKTVYDCSINELPVNILINKTYEIEMSDLELPILGNTELTKNSQSNSDQIDDAQKMNEYLSWYLSGVINKAEYDKSDSNTLINFSGPVNKLIPQAIQQAERIRSIKSAKKAERHNQIVVCAQENILGIWGKTQPHECYEGDGSKAKDDVYRLKKWEGDLSLLRKILNIIDPTNAWNKRYPPLPWSNEDGNPFSENVFFKKAYNEWLGKSCEILPMFGLVCIDNPLVKNKWAELFPYIPLSSTEDKNAKQPADPVEVQPIGDTEVDFDENHKYDLLDEVALSFPHTQEGLELSEILNSSYLPKEAGSQKIDSQTVESENDETGQCRLIDVRSNPGDDLFAEVDPNSYKVRVTPYTIKTIPCDGQCKIDEDCPNKKDKERDPSLSDKDCVTVYSKECSGGVSITIDTSVKIPNAKEIFKNTVAGDDSTFRKIFPKVEEGAPVECIANIPTVTTAQYKAVSGTSEIEVEEPDGSSGDGTDAKVYFPYIGSIYEYFLKGIQTALRPKGYGEPITNGQFCESNDQYGDVCEVADEYNIPCCQLEGIMELETGSGATVGSGSCGKFNCCNGSVCGPAQIACGQYDSFDGGDNLDMCDEVGAAELLARAMLLKLCQAAGDCDSYDWKSLSQKVKDKYKVPDGDYTSAAYFYGLNNGCYVTACSQYRWGAGNGYCDSVKSYCDTGQILPDATNMHFCVECNEELERVGQPPIICTQ